MNRASPISSLPRSRDAANQSPPYGGLNLLDSDPLLDMAISGFNDETRASLSESGAFWGSFEALELARLANRNVPVLERYDGKGNRIDRVEFHPAYHALMRRSVSSGLHASIWTNDPTEASVRNRARAARLYITAQGECGHICPMTMTNAAPATLQYEPALQKVWLPRIVSNQYDKSQRPAARKRGVTVGMGMTERAGGTDLRTNTTKADHLGEGIYRLIGQKWFMSAPMSDAFIVLAQAQRGLTCFLVPRFWDDGSANFIRFQRLKDKMGNRSNASSEAEFAGSRGWRIGEEGRGIVTLLQMVTLTRLDCAVASSGLMRAGLAEAVHHCRYRYAFGKPLIEQPMMIRVLADLSLDWAASLALSMRVALAFDFAAQSAEERAYSRLMTPVAKYWVCKTAPPFLAEAMECLGGNGYVEECSLPRLYREAPVNAIWEGSGNVMALDVMRVLRKEENALAVVLDVIRGELGPKAASIVDVLAAAAIVAKEDEGAARMLTEQLALTAAAATLKRDYPALVGDAFTETRLGGPWRNTYGMLDGRFDWRALIDYVCPDYAMRA